MAFVGVLWSRLYMQFSDLLLLYIVWLVCLLKSILLGLFCQENPVGLVGVRMRGRGEEGGNI